MEARHVVTKCGLRNDRAKKESRQGREAFLRLSREPATEKAIYNSNDSDLLLHSTAAYAPSSFATTGVEPVIGDAGTSNGTGTMTLGGEKRSPVEVVHWLAPAE